MKDTELLIPHQVTSSLMKYLSWFHQYACFTPVTQYGDSGILLKYEPNRIPGEFVLLNLSDRQFYRRRITIQGEISEVLKREIVFID